VSKARKKSFIRERKRILESSGNYRRCLKLLNTKELGFQALRVNSFVGVALQKNQVVRTEE
jgi:hypothetical protein